MLWDMGVYGISLTSVEAENLNNVPVHPYVRHMLHNLRQKISP